MADSIITKDWQPFTGSDPFNDNLVEGHISHHSGDDYGALFISKVNGDDVPQLIYCTPKIAYPFDKSGNWHWPAAIRIERYEKLDGTNVFAYRYHDAMGATFVSYKTRLLPFLQQSKFGPFLEMWREILAKHPVIEGLPQTLGMNVSFELWGARNPHLVKYDVPLAASILFARAGYLILPPCQLNHTAIEGLSVAARGSMVGAFAGSRYTEGYESAQRELEATLGETEDGYTGIEGEVWYLADTTGKWTPFKCKPETIEAIHWAAGGIGKNIIKATIENAFENWDDPTVEQVRELLLEEFAEAEVEKAHYRIAPLLTVARDEHILRERALAAYSEVGISILTDKATVMRALSGQFAKSEMRKVFRAIWNKEIS